MKPVTVAKYHWTVCCVYWGVCWSLIAFGSGCKWLGPWPTRLPSILLHLKEVPSISQLFEFKLFLSAVCVCVGGNLMNNQPHLMNGQPHCVKVGYRKNVEKVPVKVWRCNFHQASKLLKETIPLGVNLSTSRKSKLIGLFAAKFLLLVSLRWTNQKCSSSNNLCLLVHFGRYWMGYFRFC